MIELIVGGRQYSGWQTVEVTRSIEAVAGAFSLSVVRTDEGVADLVRLEEQAACSLRLDRETVITGHIDRFSPSMTADSVSLNVQGRDATSDLVDCAALNRPPQWLNQTVATILAEICAPFGIATSAPGDTGNRFPSFVLEPDEQAIDAIRRLCQGRGLLLIADRAGGLTLVQPAATLEPVSLVEGVNLVSFAADFDATELFSVITVRGQSATTPDAKGRTTNGATASATAKGVIRYRPLVLEATGQATAADCQRQANWELASRNGKALTATATVVGWRQKPDGRLWDINQLVSVDCPTCFVEEPLIVASVTYRIDEQGGTMADLSLMRRNALLAEIPAAPKQKEGQTGRQVAVGRKMKPESKAKTLGLYTVGADGKLTRTEN